MISKDRFENLVNFKPANLNIIISYFNKYVDDLSDEILKNAFESNSFAVIRAVSDKRFKEILLKLLNQESVLNSLFVRYRSFISEEEIRTLIKKFGNNVNLLLKNLDEKIETKKKSEVTAKSEVKMEVKAEEESKAEEERKRKEEEKKIKTQKKNHRTRNVISRL